MVHDKDIKKTLEKRSIQPSSTSWGRLETMLDAKEEAVPAKSYFRYTIAASVLVLLGSLAFFMNSGSSINQVQPVVVETDNNRTIEPPETIKNTPDEPLKVADGEHEVVENTMLDIDKMDNKDAVNPLKNIPQRHTELASVVGEKRMFKAEKISSNSEENTVGVDSFMIATSTNDDDNNLDAEVDMLLALATQEISKLPQKKSTNKSTITVDADALLADVEQELDLSFKANVFNKLKSGFQKTKTAVIKRNDN